MTEKVWFVLNGDDPFGPYNLLELVDLLLDEGIHESDYAFSENSNKKIRVYDIPGLMEMMLPEDEYINISNKDNPEPFVNNKLELPPIPISSNPVERSIDLPPLPELPDIPSNIDKIFRNEDIEITTQEIEKEKILIEDKAIFIDKDDSINFEHEQDEFLAEEIPSYQLDKCLEIEEKSPETVEQTESNSSFNLMALGLCFFGLCISLYWISFWKKTEYTFFNIGPSKKESLERVINHPSSSNPIFRLSLGKKGNGIWIATNLKFEGEVELELHGSSNNILGEGPVILKGNSKLRDGKSYISMLTILEGLGAYYGNYNYSIKVFPTGPAYILKKWLNESYNVSTKNKEMITYEDKGEFLYYPGTSIDFKKKLKIYKDKLERNKLRPLNNMLQLYQTYLSLLNRVQDLYNKAILDIKTGSDIQKEFENSYNIEVGPYLRDLILDNNRLHISLLNLKPLESEKYEELMNFGKEIGELASNMVTETRQYQKLNKYLRVQLKNKMNSIGNSIEEKGKMLSSRLRVESDLLKAQISGP